VFAHALCLAACGGSAGEPTPAPVAALKIVSGQNQVGAVGAELPAATTLMTVDVSGQPVRGVVVAFAVITGGGSFSNSRDTSDAAGIVTSKWSLGTVAASPQTATATVVSTSTTAPPIPATQLTATAVAGPAVAVVVSPTTASGRMGEIIATPIVAGLQDTYGNRVPRAGVVLTSTLQDAASTALATGASSRTDTSGMTTFAELSATGRVGTFTMLVSSDGTVAGRVALTLLGGAPNKIDVSTNPIVQAVAHAPGPPLSARVFDKWENPSATATVTFAIVGGAVIGEATADATGTATLVTWTVPAIGSYQVVATAGGATAGAHIMLNAQLGAVASLTEAPNSARVGEAGAEVRALVVARDVGGNPLSNQAIQWQAGVASGSSITGADGIAVFFPRLAQLVGDNQIVVRAGTLTTNFVIRGVAGPVMRIIPAAPSITAPAGSQAPLGFVAADQFGNLAAGAVLSMALPAGILSATADANGVARFNVTLEPFAGTYLYSVFAPASPNPLIANATITVYATSTRGTLRLPVLNCGTTTASIVGFNAQVFGPDGRPAPNVLVTFSIAPGTGGLFSTGASPTSTVTKATNASGDASINWSFLTPGTHVMTVTSSPGFDALSPATMVCRVS
jgi:hypothetical protein